MALPHGVATATVTTGIPVSASGTPVIVSVSIEPSAYLVHTSTGTPLVDFIEKLPATQGVAARIDLPLTDQDGFQDETGQPFKNWHYTARITYSTVDGKTKTPMVKVFQINEGQTLVQLETIPSGVPAMPSYVPTAPVTSVNGRTGAVVLEDADFPGWLGKAPATVPAGPHARGYDARLNMYNIAARHVRKFRAGIARVRGDLGQLTIAGAGDSTMFGLGTPNPGQDSVLAQLAWCLDRNELPSYSSGLVAAYQSTPDPRWTFGDGWTLFQASSNLMANSTTTNPVTFTPDNSGTAVRIVFSEYAQPFQVSINGAAPVTITPSGQFEIGERVLTGLPPVATVAITRSNGALYLLGVEVFTPSGDERGVRIFNAGISGLKSAELATDNWTDVMGYITDRLKPDLLILRAGTNDRAALVPVATFKANMGAAITNAKTAGCDVLLMTPIPSDGLDFAEYRGALYELADEKDVPLLDVLDRRGSYADADAAGLMDDGWHANAAGYADEARAIYLGTGV